MCEFSDKNLLPLAKTSFSTVEVFHDCSGGNSRPSCLSGVGGGTFLMTEREWRRNVQGRLTGKSRLFIRHLSFVINSAFVIRALSFYFKIGTNLLAGCVDTRCVHGCSSRDAHFPPVGNLAGAHSPARYSPTRKAG